MIFVFHALHIHNIFVKSPTGTNGDLTTGLSLRHRSGGEVLHIHYGVIICGSILTDAVSCSAHAGFPDTLLRSD